MAAIAKFISYDGGIAFSDTTLKIQLQGEDATYIPIDEVSAIKVVLPQNDAEGSIRVQTATGERYQLFFDADQYKEAVQFKRKFNATAGIKDTPRQRQATGQQRRPRSFFIPAVILGVLILGVILFFVIRGVGASRSVANLDAYKEAVSICRDDINAASLVLGNMTNYESNYLKISGNPSDAMVDAALQWLTENANENRETIDAAYNSIRQQYKDIALTEISGKEAEEIGTSVQEMYDAYISLHDLALMPTGSKDDFDKNSNTYVLTIASASRDLTLFLDGG